MKKTKLSAVLALALGLLLPHQALAWADKGFAYRKAITADARAGGLTEGAKSYPVLVRLNWASSTLLKRRSRAPTSASTTATTRRP